MSQLPLGKTFDLLILQYNRMHPEDQAEITLGDFIAENFDLMKNIRNGIAAVRTDRLDLEADYKKETESLNQRMRTLQARCPHVETEADLASRDSICKLCGAIV